MRSTHSVGLFLLIAALCAFSLTAEAAAQGRVGVGAQAGDVSGLTLKLGPTGRAYEFAAAWNFEAESVLLQAHLLLDQPVLDGTGTGRFQWFYGPGGVLALRTDDIGDDGREDEVAVGASFTVGAAYFPAPAFELFAQFTPRLLVVPASDLDLGAAVGFRFYP